uniref:Candidate secreted effector n=1 Tax=Meloidogyne incognita TaxID=6306 RepID=A0A914L746_MELIC
MKSSLFLFNGSNKQQQTFSNKTIIMFAVVIVVILLGNIGKSQGEDHAEVQLNQSLVTTNNTDYPLAFSIDNSTAPDNNNDNNNNSLPEIITDPGIKIIYKRSDDGPFWAVVIIICAILYICYSVCCFACSK